jgi:serine protease
MGIIMNATVLSRLHLASKNSFAIYILLLALSACGGGGGGGGGSAGDDDDNNSAGSSSSSSSSSGAATTFSISGSIQAPASTAVDGDTNDPNAPFTPNNMAAEAQAIPNPVTLGGFATAIPTGFSGDRFESENDVIDGYRVTLYEGQTITLQISDHDSGDPEAVDLDLYLYDADIDIVQSSLTSDATESITVAVADGTYDVVVFAFNGSSNYTLTIGQAPASALKPALRLEDEFVPNEVLVQLNPSPKASAKALASISALGLNVKGGDASRVMRLELGNAQQRQALLAGKGIQHKSSKPGDWFSTMSPATRAKYETIAALKALRARNDIQSADLNYINKPQLVPDDEYYDLQWHYPLIRLPQAWDVSTGTPASGNVIVAVVDTGVFMAHPDLAPNLLATGYDFISSSSRANDGGGIDGNPNDSGDNATPGGSSFHGTHVAGTIAAASDNAGGIAGVSWGAKIMPIRVLGIGGGTDYDIIQGIRYAAGLSNDSNTVPPQKADIINLSLGGPGFSQTVQNAYTAVRNTGTIIIAAAGNENNSTLFYPAAYEGVVSVAAVDFNKNRAPYSNFNSRVDVAAPGGNTAADLNGDGYQDGVLSTLSDDSDTSFYGFHQGTSMAAPHMAGVVALMKAIEPTMTPTELDALLVSGAITQDTGSDGATVRNNNFGYGMIDALKAVEAAVDLAGGTPPTIVTASPTPLDFSNNETALPFTLTRTGGGALTVTGVTDNADWLSVAPDDVDGSGFGDYIATVNRTGLIDATYPATITVTTSTASTVQIQVTMIVGALSSNTGSDAGFHYILLVDPDSGMTVDQATASVEDGVYQYQFNDVAPGSYYIGGGTDLDNDFLLCDAGEACGIYPTMGLPAIIEITDDDLSGIDFVTGFISELGASNAGEAAPVAPVFRRIQYKRQQLQ